MYDVFRGVSTADMCSDFSAEERYERECKVNISHLYLQHLNISRGMSKCEMSVTRMGLEFGAPKMDDADGTLQMVQVCQ